MFNKDNVFITVNEEVSSITQQYIIREIKKILDKYKSITTEEIISVEKLINSISNKELKEEFLNDWSMSVKIAKEIGENEVDDRIISMYQNLKGNGLEELTIGHVINWCNEYKDYHDKLIKLNDKLSKELGIKYDENMIIIIVKNNDKLRRI